MTERMNPPPLAVQRIADLKELKRSLGAHLQRETDASAMWNEYVWSYTIAIFELFYEHYIQSPDFIYHAEKAAQDNAVLSSMEVISRQLYNFDSMRPSYEKKVFEVISDHIKRKKIQLGSLLLPPSGAVAKALTDAALLATPLPGQKLRRLGSIESQLHCLKKESRLTFDEIAKGIELDVSSVKRHFAGRNKPRSKQVRAYEQFFGGALSRKVQITSP